MMIRGRIVFTLNPLAPFYQRNINIIIIIPHATTDETQYPRIDLINTC